jgi:hypothetical protein
MNKTAHKIAIHGKHNFKYPTVKVCIIWCNDVYMYILYCDIFWLKLIDKIFLNEIFKTTVVSFWRYSWRQMIIPVLVSEASNRYTHLFLVEREYFGFNILESVIVEWLCGKRLYNLVQWCLYVYSLLRHFLIEINRQDFFKWDF